MGNFTIPLWEAIEQTGGHIVREDGMMIPRETLIGIEHYPIFDERHRDTLNSHIVSRYYNMEIAHSTVQEFRMRLQAELALNMPTFNKMYEANLLEFDPLTTMRVENEREDTSTQDATTEGKSDVSGGSKNWARNVSSDTPQTRLYGDADYASGAVDANSGGESETQSREESQAETNIENKGKSLSTGYTTSPAALVRQRQELLLNVDRMVVESLQGLFFGLWNNYDSYSEGSYVY